MTLPHVAPCNGTNKFVEGQASSAFVHSHTEPRRSPWRICPTTCQLRLAALNTLDEAHRRDAAAITRTSRPGASHMTVEPCYERQRTARIVAKRVQPRCHEQLRRPGRWKPSTPTLLLALPCASYAEALDASSCPLKVFARENADQSAALPRVTHVGVPAVDRPASRPLRYRFALSKRTGSGRAFEVVVRKLCPQPRI